ncbi:MAG TPA: hypothetical protein VF229_05545 [Burkholderiaceae bacterium]
MKPSPLGALAIALALAVQVCTAGAQSLRVAQANALIVIQDVSDSRSGARSAVEVRVGRPAASTRDGAVQFGLSAASRPASALGVNGMPVRDYGTGAHSLAEIEADANSAMTAARADLDRQLDAAMAATGSSAAYFSFAQRVEPAGTSQPMVLAWSYLRVNGGGATYAAPRLHRALPVFVYVRYTPLRVDADLPSGIVYENAGKLAWSLVDSRLQRLGPEGTVDTRGAFDEPLDNGGAPFSPDSALDCLVDHRGAACDPRWIDVRTLMQQHAADAAFVDYRRRLAPLRLLSQQQAAAPGWQIQMSIAVDRRVLTFNRCGSDAVTYRNIGRRGISLLAVSERYLVGNEPVPMARLIGSASGLEMTQPLDYDKRIVVTRDTALHLGDRIINPVGDDRSLVTAGEVPGLMQLAAVEQTGDTSDTLLSRRSLFAPMLPDDRGDLVFALWWDNTFTCRIDGLVRYEARAPLDPSRPLTPEISQIVDPGDRSHMFYARTLTWPDFVQLCRQYAC